MKNEDEAVDVLRLDDVIDPETRDWIAQGLRRVPPAPPSAGKKYPCLDRGESDGA